MAITPHSIRLEATSHCQLRCPSCPTASGAIRPVIGAGHLRLADFRQLIDANPTVRHVELSNYGEIFLNPDLLRIMEHASRRAVRLSAGNGVNFNHAKDEVIEGLAKYGFARLTVSLDGASQATYAQYRVRGDFDRVIANLRKLNAYKAQYQTEGPQLHWQFIVFGHNEHEIAQAQQLARELNMTFAPKLTWDDDFSPLRDRALVQQATGLTALTRREHEASTGRDYLAGICRQLWHTPQINWDGKILGCGRNFWGDFGGNAFRDGLAQSLNSEKMNYARAMLRGEKEARADIPCTTCDIYHKRRRAQDWVQPDATPSTPSTPARASRLRRFYVWSGARKLRVALHKLRHGV